MPMVWTIERLARFPAAGSVTTSQTLKQTQLKPQPESCSTGVAKTRIIVKQYVPSLEGQAATEGASRTPTTVVTDS